MNWGTEDFYEEENEINESLKRYELMLQKGAKIYFDVIQIEYITERFIEEAKFMPALQAVDMGIEMHPTSIALKVRKTNILFNIGEIEQSLKLSNKLLLIEKTNHELHLLKGSALLLLGNKREADQSFQLALEYSIDDKEEVLFNIGFAYEQSGNYKRAIHYMQKVLEINPESESALYEMAFSYEKIDENEKSLAFYNRYLDIDTFSDSAWFNMGIIHTKLNRIEESIEAYEYALAINEDFPNAWFNLGHSNMILTHYEKAIDAFNTYTRYDDANDEVFCLIGECYLKSDNIDEAFNSFQKAITFNKTNAQAYFGVGLTLKLKNELHQSMKYLQKALNYDETNSDYWYVMGEVSSALSYHDLADDSFFEACNLAPDNLPNWLGHAQMLYKKGRVIKAISVLNEAQKHHNNNALINYRLAAYLLESDNEPKAIKHLEKALINDYKNYNYLFETYPEARYSDSVNKLISKYNPINS
ncbi:MAG: tetratricopeptide repeat protein [Prolixibacteraceae bacterium]|nr:tetratricopeptide repeat protein [Prolixibacteraceae bacterium]